MLPLIIRRKFSAPSVEAPAGAGKSKLYAGVMEQVKSALTVDLQASNGYCDSGARTPSPEGYAVNTSLSGSFAHLVFRSNRLPGLSKKEQSESTGDSSGTEASGRNTKGKRRFKKKGASTPVVEPVPLNKVPVDILQSWQACFNTLLSHPDGMRLFEDYLKSEYSEENIQFWKACEKFKTLPDHQLEVEAVAIYNEFIDPEAAKLVNIDHKTTKGIEEHRSKPTRSMFQEAQQSIYLLMARDSFVRFIKSEAFQAALKR